jgi:hypothetical protein
MQDVDHVLRRKHLGAADVLHPADLSHVRNIGWTPRLLLHAIKQRVGTRSVGLGFFLFLFYNLESLQFLYHYLCSFKHPIILSHALLY